MNEDHQIDLIGLNCMALTLVVNGNKQEFEALDAGSVLNVLLETLSLKTDRVALELNGIIVPRLLWPETHLVDGDKIELVHFVGGGSNT